MCGLASFKYTCFIGGRERGGSEDHYQSDVTGSGIEIEKKVMRLMQVPFFACHVSCLSGKTVQQAYKVGSAIRRLTQQHCTLNESWETPPQAYLFLHS